MDFLEERIKKDGHVYPGNILKVDSFLNHQIDVSLMDQVGEAFYEKYKDRGITKILTIEASGIAIAYATARAFGVPLLFAKKTQSLNIGNDVYAATVSSFTYKKDYQVVISKKYLGPDDHVVIVDDFLATGNAMFGLTEICKMAGAAVEGIGICIEKGFQNGGKQLREMGYSVTSLAIIESMSDDGGIVFQS
ncbi:MAG: xanthine phosphoribosyltransferase [Eubacterium sp.]|nr:xanthine phosphoribosyltransferase [Eubacterium sp.]MBR6218122.1 xanthine phosphoribosyltransferase [Eubacterium sp.]